MKKLLILGCLLLAGCDDRESTLRKTTFTSFSRLYTVDHDHHLFVVIMNSNEPAGVIHHPGCPCLEKELK